MKKKTIPYLLIVMLVGCLEEPYQEPYIECTDIGVTVFPTLFNEMGHNSNRNYIWPYNWPYTRAVFEFNDDSTFTFKADFPCDTPYGKALDCDTIDGGTPFAPLRMSGTYQFIQDLEPDRVQHFGKTNQLIGKVILKDIATSNSILFDEAINGSFSLKCEGEELFRSTGGPVGEFYWSLKRHFGFTIDIPINQGVIYSFRYSLSYSL